MVAAAGREVDSAETAKRYIRSMFEARDHVAILAVPRRSPGAGVVQEVMPVEKLAAAATQERFGRLNRQGYDVYCTVNTMASDAKTRTKADVQNVRRLQLDLDHNGREGLQKLRRDVDAGQVPTPAIVMQSSRGRFQVLWHTEPNGWTPARAEETMRRLAARYGGDRAVADVARVMRMPGFRNCKDGREEWQVTWARYDSTRTQLRDFRSLPPAPTVTITPNLDTQRPRARAAPPIKGRIALFGAPGFRGRGSTVAGSAPARGGG